MEEIKNVLRLEDGKFMVKSHSNKGVSYEVALDPPSCSCPHFANRLAQTWEGSEEGQICKHIEDVLVYEGKMKEEQRSKRNSGPWLSKNKYSMDEVTSALQKAIRRGKEAEAGYWACEMVDSGYWRYLLHRLQTIAAEDIGLANPEAIVIVNAVRQGIEGRWAEMKERGKNWMPVPMEQIGFLILYLCRSPKSRMADDFIWYVQKKRKEGHRLEIPEYAVDEHTKRGKTKISLKAKEEGRLVGKVQEEEFYLKGGLLQGGDHHEEIGGINWSEKLFEEMGLAYTGYELEE